ncbi:Hypothetical predicted protein [Scomber scombrus]|uniref:Uncharacterized protein n=1 Tax=Scomber scombrus TaxID=13677 RepID=A0AAV1PGU3_SCOSC
MSVDSSPETAAEQGLKRTLNESSHLKQQIRRLQSIRARSTRLCYNVSLQAIRTLNTLHMLPSIPPSNTMRLHIWTQMHQHYLSFNLIAHVNTSVLYFKSCSSLRVCF